jgi:hypothetical protein
MWLFSIYGRNSIIFVFFVDPEFHIHPLLFSHFNQEPNLRYSRIVIQSDSRRMDDAFSPL